MLNLTPWIACLALAAAPLASSETPVKPWGFGLNLGGGEIFGIHAMRNFSRVQVRVHTGYSGSVTESKTEKTGLIEPGDTLKTASLDAIFGVNARYYFQSWAYAASGLALNNREIFSEVMNTLTGERVKATLRRRVVELPVLIGMEMARDSRISAFAELGYVLQLNRAGEDEYLQNEGFPAHYRHPTGTATVGLGITFNFGR